MTKINKHKDMLACRELSDTIITSVATSAEPRNGKGVTLRKHNCLRERSGRVLCF